MFSPIRRLYIRPALDNHHLFAKNVYYSQDLGVVAYELRLSYRGRGLQLDKLKRLPEPEHNSFAIFRWRAR